MNPTVGRILGVAHDLTSVQRISWRVNILDGSSFGISLFFFFLTARVIFRNVELNKF